MADLIKLRQNPEHDYALRLTRDEAVLLAATLGAMHTDDHVLRRPHATGEPDVVATGQHLFDVLHATFDEVDDYHELSLHYDRHFDDAPHFPDVTLPPATAGHDVGHDDLVPPTGYAVLRRRPVPGDTVQPRWLDPAPSTGERNVLAAARTVHGVDRDHDGNVRVWVSRDRRDTPYVWHDDRQRYVLANGFDVDLLASVNRDDRYVRPWHDVRPGQTVAVVSGLHDDPLSDPRPHEYRVAAVDREAGRVTGIRLAPDRAFYRLDSHDRFAGPIASVAKLVWPR